MGFLIPAVKVLEGINFVGAIIVMFIGGGTVAAFVVHSDYSYKVEQIARLETAQISVYFEEVTARINTGGQNLCGLQGTYQVEIELIATIDLDDIIKNGNIFSRWDQLPEPNITTAYAKSVKPRSETTNFGCNVSFTDTRELAKTVALVEISKSIKYQDLLDETKTASLNVYSELTGVALNDITFYDNDKGRTFAVDILNPPCWGLTENNEFIKTC